MLSCLYMYVHVYTCIILVNLQWRICMYVHVHTCMYTYVEFAEEEFQIYECYTRQTHSLTACQKSWGGIEALIKVGSMVTPRTPCCKQLQFSKGTGILNVNLSTHINVKV